MRSPEKGVMSAAMQVKVLSPEIIPCCIGPKVLYLGSQYRNVRIGECISDVPGFESVAGKRTVCIGTWENRNVSNRSCRGAEKVTKRYDVSIDRDKLMDFIRIRISDTALLSLIGKFLKADYIDDGQLVRLDKAHAANGFSCWEHLVCLLFCCLAGADYLREICGGLASSMGKMVHLGVKRSPCIWKSGSHIIFRFSRKIQKTLTKVAKNVTLR